MAVHFDKTLLQLQNPPKINGTYQIKIALVQVLPYPFAFGSKQSVTFQERLSESWLTSFHFLHSTRYSLFVNGRAAGISSRNRGEMQISHRIALKFVQLRLETDGDEPTRISRRVAETASRRWKRVSQVCFSLIHDVHFWFTQNVEICWAGILFASARKTKDCIKRKAWVFAPIS